MECKMKNWKTTIGGLLMTIGLALSQAEELKNYGLILQGIGGILLGLAAKDASVTGAQ
jgi:hypothetical protein